MKLTVNEIISACRGELKNPSGRADFFINGVSIDSRAVALGNLFVPVKGENFDGHDYIKQAEERGAACALTEKPDGINLNIPLIKVASTRKALLDLSAYFRSKYDVKVVAVTGSSGKTTTKDITAHILSKRFKTLKNEGNFNNAIGMPLTIFKLEAEHEILVLEMGMNRFGEISELSVTARPDVAMITNIGCAHIQNLGSREGILKAKMEIFEGMDGGSFILNKDDPMLCGTDIPCENVYSCSVKEKAYAYAESITDFGLEGTGFVLNIGGQKRNVRIKQPGAHLVMNNLMASAACAVLGMDINDIADGVETFEPAAGGRMSVREVDGFTLIDDAYNANPDSMRAAVEILSSAKKRSMRAVCVLGDMLELGDYSKKFHTELGEYAAGKKIDLLIAIGEHAKNIYDGYKNAGSHGEAVHFEDKNQFISERRNFLREGDAVLVKASRGMEFEKIVQALSNPSG